MKNWKIAFAEWGRLGGKMGARRLAKAYRKHSRPVSSVIERLPRKQVVGSSKPSRGTIDLIAPINKEKDERDKKIKKMALAGATLQDIGDQYGVTRERARQWLYRLGLTAHNTGMIARSTKKYQEQRKAKELKNNTFLPHYGCTKAEVLKHNEGKVFTSVNSLAHLFARQQQTARNRAIKWEMTFPEWVEVWKNSGQLPHRGRGKGKFCLSRKGDKGPYSVENVVVKTNEDNNKERGLVRAPKDSNGLTERQRQCYELHIIGKSAKEIGVSLGISYHAAWVYLDSAKKILAMSKQEWKDIIK